MENKKKAEKVIAFSCDTEIELPKDIQKRMMDFFLKTSIPRKKAGCKGHLSKDEGDR